MKINFLKIFFLGFAFAIFSACQQPSSQTSSSTSQKKSSTQNESTKIQTVEVVQPKLRSFNAVAVVTGTAMPNQEVMLHAMESGFIKSIKKDIGDKVDKGTTIATLSNPELAAELKMAQAKLSTAQAAKTKAESEVGKYQAQASAKTSIYERLQSILDKTPDLTTIDQVEQAKADAAAMQAEITAANANIKVAETEISAAQSVVDAVQMRINMLTIKAPFKGIITKRYVDAGASIQSGMSNSDSKPVVMIQDIDPIRLSVPLPESDAAAVQIGMETVVTFPALPGEEINATISRTSGVLDAASKTMTVEIDIDNADGKIKPGMYAKVFLQNASREDVLSLPVTAQFLYQDEPYVLTVNDDNVVERIALRKGLTGKDFFEVLNADIKKETKVITKGKSLVKAGQIVEAILKK